MGAAGLKLTQVADGSFGGASISVDDVERHIYTQQSRSAGCGRL
jgi:hypothetical protein